jgi:release factor glutamine methyltransferase
VVCRAAEWLAPGGIVLSEITEAQVDTALATIEDAGLAADLGYDDDLEARVVRGQKTVGPVR